MGNQCCTTQICSLNELKFSPESSLKKDSLIPLKESQHQKVYEQPRQSSSVSEKIENPIREIKQEYNETQKEDVQFEEIKEEQGKEQENDKEINIIPNMPVVIQEEFLIVKQTNNEQQSKEQFETKIQSVERKQKQSATILQQQIQRKPEHRSTNASINTIKLGADIFINLKQGCIHNYYNMGQVLGQGGYGKVWKVTHKATGFVRAMKQLKKSALIKEEQQRLFSEMTILKNLDHPHIVKLYELFQDTQNYYLITEYLSGGELFERIRSMNYFSEKKAADLMGQILSAIIYCHDQKIVHRDLKPENIIFVSQEVNSSLKVIDFGTSRKFNSKKKMTKKLGTPYYIAPEVIKQDYNEKCDVWSCGVILYILLCGYPPFRGRNEKEIMDKVKEGVYTFDRKQLFINPYKIIAEEWGTISKEAKCFIGRMLQIDPNVRISARNALKDPWMQKYALSSQISQKALVNLQQFQAKSVFQQAILSYIASQMTSQEEITELQKTFKGLDKNTDGQDIKQLDIYKGMLSKDELIEGYTKFLIDKKKAEEEVNKILHLIDLNQSGKVDFTGQLKKILLQLIEFLMAAMNQEKLLSAEKVKAAFKVFDQNGDGKISRQEIQEVMGEIDEELWLQILQDCGNSNEGFITELEFIKILNQKI